MSTHRIVVKTHIDYDRETLQLSPEWVQARLELFHRTTLKSLLNQTDGDFDVLVLCGNRHEEITRNYPWSPRVIPCWDKGQAYFAAQSTDYLAIARLDSDDLYHREAVATLRTFLRFRPRRVVTLIFRENLRWDKNNNVLGFHYRKAPPFFTHVLPKAMYRNWDCLQSVNYVTHGASGAKTEMAIALPRHLVCVVKHKANISDIRRSRDIMTFTRHQRLRLTGADPWVEKYAILTADQFEVESILAEFGVAPDD